MPKRRAFRPRRQVAATNMGAGVTQSDRDDCDARFVVETVAVKVEPLSKAVAAGIVPRDTRRVNTGAWGLADDQQPRRRRSAQHGSGPEGQIFDAATARPRFRGDERECPIVGERCVGLGCDGWRQGAFPRLSGVGMLSLGLKTVATESRSFFALAAQVLPIRPTILHYLTVHRHSCI